MKALEPKSAESPRHPTAGRILHDGIILDLLRDPGPPRRINLIAWDGRVVKTGPEIRHLDEIYKPLDVDPSVASALLLPTRVAPLEPTSELFGDVRDLFPEHVGQLNRCTKLLVYAIFASWASRFLAFAPIVWIFCPPGSPKSQLMQLLTILCRRSLHLVGATRGDLRSLPMSIRPTLLLDEPDPTTLPILLASARRGAHIRTGSRIVDPYGPKFICSQHLPHATMIGTDALRVSLTPPTGQLKLLDREAEQEIAEEFQARFLAYFLHHCRNFEIPDLDVSHLTFPVQGLAQTLAASVAGDKNLQSELLRLLVNQDEENRADLANSFDSLVVEGVLFFIHQGGWSEIRSAAVAEKVAAISKGRGVDRAVSAESVGWAFRRLGIPSGRLGRAGNGVLLSGPTCRLVHRLAFSYGVRSIAGGLRENCPYCDELKA